jgi:hypothetical protein
LTHDFENVEIWIGSTASRHASPVIAGVLSQAYDHSCQHKHGEKLFSVPL